MEEWLSTMPAATATAMATKIVELWFRGSEEGQVHCKYKVMSQVVGFVNDHHGIQQRPNAILQWNPERPLGQHSLMLKLTTTVEADQEIVISYRRKHRFGRRKLTLPGIPNAKKRRTTRGIASAMSKAIGSASTSAQVPHG